MADHVDRRIEGNFSRGWPFAIFITLLAVGAFVTAGLIHRATFRSPTDVTAEYRRQSPGVEGADTTHRPAAH
ncbi:MAG TPA: hypothetical protein VFZ21_22175 [Gemmatimonadaceae bacterium]|jgi:hypothetical protein|nr:hypothetical protein [Gemmatimonadaceae bacterium]